MRRFKENKHHASSNMLLVAEPPFDASENELVDKASRLALCDLASQIYGPDHEIQPIQINSSFCLDRTCFKAPMAGLQIEVSPQRDGKGIHIHTAHNPSAASENFLIVLASSLTKLLPK